MASIRAEKVGVSECVCMSVCVCVCVCVCVRERERERERGGREERMNEKSELVESFSCHVYSAYLTTDVSPCTLFSWGDMYVYVFQSTLWLCATHVYSRSVYSDACICFVLVLPLSVLLLIKTSYTYLTVVCIRVWRFIPAIASDYWKTNRAKK